MYVVSLRGVLSRRTSEDLCEFFLKRNLEKNLEGSLLVNFDSRTFQRPVVVSPSHISKPFLSEDNKQRFGT